jgi:hypothetical protein
MVDDRIWPIQLVTQFDDTKVELRYEIEICPIINPMCSDLLGYIPGLFNANEENVKLMIDEWNFCNHGYFSQTSI